MDILVAVVLLSLIGTAGSTFYAKQPYIDPACQLGDCSWEYSYPADNGNDILTETQGCRVADYPDKGVLDGMCPNPFPVPESEDDWAAPIEREDITIEDFSKYFDANITGNIEDAGNYTCLRIKYKISKYVAGKIDGIQLTVRGANSGDLGLYFCQNHIHAGDKMEFYAAQSYINQKFVQREFTYECFCGIKPGNDYQFVIRTLPVDYSNPGDRHESAVVLTYPHDSEDPNSSCDNHRQDKRCEWSVEARWYPKCQSAEQILSGDYDRVNITFDLAPEEMNFDRYKVLLYEQCTTANCNNYRYIDGDVLKITTPNQANYQTSPGSCNPASNTTLITSLDLPKHGNTLIKTCYFVAVQAYPTKKTCHDADGAELAGGCPAKRSQQFCVIANPCSDNPCSDSGICHPDGEKYSCTCDESYMFQDGTCLKNPCYNNSCIDQAGQCNMYKKGEKDYGYSCSCYEGFMLNSDETTCIADPCYSKPCASGACQYIDQAEDQYSCLCDTGFESVAGTCKANPCITQDLNQTKTCGDMGQCVLDIPSDRSYISYNCTCHDGYHESLDPDGLKTCSPINSPQNLIIAITSAVVFAILLIVLLLILRYRKKEVDKVMKALCNGEGENQNPNIAYIQADPVNSIHEVPEGTPRVLILYSVDHDLHKDCIRKLATFLHQVCNCKIKLDMWDTTKIGDKKFWLWNEIANADKVLIIFSKGTLHKYKALMQQKPVDDSHCGEYGDMFLPGYKIATDEFEKEPSLLNKKYVAAHMEYSQTTDVLPEMRNTARYVISSSLEQLYLRLHDIPAHSPRSTRRVQNLQPNMYKNCPEGKALHDAIEKMKAYVREYPKWYEAKLVRRMDSDNGYNSMPNDGSPPHEDDPLNSFFQQGGGSSGGSSQSIAFTDLYQFVSQPGDSGCFSELRQPPDIQRRSFEAEFDIDMVMKANSISDTDSVSSAEGLHERQQLMTLNSTDVEMHPHPSHISRMDSGFDYMSDFNLVSQPLNKETTLGTSV